MNAIIIPIVAILVAGFGIWLHFDRNNTRMNVEMDMENQRIKTLQYFFVDHQLWVCTGKKLDASGGPFGTAVTKIVLEKKDADEFSPRLVFPEYDNRIQVGSIVRLCVAKKGEALGIYYFPDADLLLPEFVE